MSESGTFTSETQFEEALTQRLATRYGWEGLAEQGGKILEYATEAELLQNWANILYHNNRNKERLGDYPLTEGEMQQLIEHINRLRTPLHRHNFILGGSVSIKRDHPEDVAHFGREVSLEIYSPYKIAAGESCYQIVRQPKFPTPHPLTSDRRGDVMLLINGMPLFHIELKRSGIPVDKAVSQIEKYSKEGVFSQGLFSLVQLFVAMTPEETLYFANPGADTCWTPDYHFHWADANNKPIHCWKYVAERLLSIPQAHQMIGFYLVADNNDNVLKVMRSYQYYAVSQILSRAEKMTRNKETIYGGYVWHTTGSGKTMTSFKAAQLLADSDKTDKVIFLMDRIELGTQSLQEFRGFAGDGCSVQATEDTSVLIAKLCSDNHSDRLIVTSIHKMSHVTPEEGVNEQTISSIAEKRLIFIVDEAHRSTFGKMLLSVKEHFPGALFFGFTGTPILEPLKELTQADIFGSELHRYTIADGIRDKNVLGFDPYLVETYSERDLRREVGLRAAGASCVEEALSCPVKKAAYLAYQDRKQIPMAEQKKGIESLLPLGQYDCDTHRRAVIEDIDKGWDTLSRGGKFHALLATHSIPEALAYYRLFQEMASHLKVTLLVDPGIDNDEGAFDKEMGLAEVLGDYNRRYGQTFTLPTFDKFKKDVAARLAHKQLHEHLRPEEQLDIVIVVNQMLTGFDSKWINTLYLDKMLESYGLIQAFSRTNRLFGSDKPFGTIRYYRKPHTMRLRIEEAFKEYSGSEPEGLFVFKLLKHLTLVNESFMAIDGLFAQAGVAHFAKLPEDPAAQGQFAKFFNQLRKYLEAATLQGFRWEQRRYEDREGKEEPVEVMISQEVYLTLVQRCKELSDGGSGGGSEAEIPYDLEAYISEVNTARIDQDYMNSQFKRWERSLASPSELERSAAWEELHKSFAHLSKGDQRYAELFLQDVESGKLHPEEGRTLSDYIVAYKGKAQSDEIMRVVQGLGLDELQFKKLLRSAPMEDQLNEFGRFDKLKETVDLEKAKPFLEAHYNIVLNNTYEVNLKIDIFLRDFIFSDAGKSHSPTL